MNIFKTRKPKQFEYKPRYYDPEKYDREIRREKMGLAPGQTREERMRASMRYDWEKKQQRRAKQRGGLLKMLLYLLLVVILLMFILK